MFIIIIILAVLLEICVFHILETRHIKYCNSNYIPNNYGIVLPKYKIIKIEKVYNKNYTEELAKYTIRNMYAINSNNTREQTLVLYDKIGKYNIGDTLVFITYNN